MSVSGTSTPIIGGSKEDANENGIFAKVCIDTGIPGQR